MGKKYSIYNTLLRLSGERGLLYNAMSDKYVVLRANAYDLIATQTVEFLSFHHTGLFSQLEKADAVVDEEVDEVQRLRDLIRQVDEDDTAFHLHVNPTVDCNFRCWYCYENHVIGSRMSRQTAGSVCRLIDNILATHPNLRYFDLSFFGGEPLMYFPVVARPLMEHLTAVCRDRHVEAVFHFTTNGFLLTKEMVGCFSDKNVSFQITLDGCREQHDKVRFMRDGRGSFDTIVRNVRLLVMQSHHVTVRINYTWQILDGLQDIAREFSGLDAGARPFLHVDFQRVWQDVGTAPDERGVEEKVYSLIGSFRQKGIDAYCQRGANRVRNSCYGDKRGYALVNYDGNVFGCTARDFTESNRMGWLSADGELHYEQDAKEKRMAAKFSKPVCHTCRIAPLCGGGCSQKAMECASENLCLYHYTEKDKDNQVLERFDYLYPLREGRQCVTPS